MYNAKTLLKQIETEDAYLIPYLKSWWGIGPTLPWGAAMGFALEVAIHYGIIKGESDASPSTLGEKVKKLLDNPHN